ncbi:hypothetical protein E2C01_019378 [Portunus trituberculatus]|uniref:Uncharacterized protein n=1 Tax=Portunus trituberculatus TaxID=210409 RepID=A0A5B7DX14_PORTR|nr:hypothetical protein [Portunus trituberculatus]
MYACMPDTITSVICSAQRDGALTRKQSPQLAEARRQRHLRFGGSCGGIGEPGKDTESAVVQWNHACFGVRWVSKRTDSNPVHGLSVGWGSSLGATVS